MAMLDIKTYGDPVLRGHCEPVAQIVPSIEQLVQEMTETMYESQGVGLAAPQVGRTQRIIVVDASLGQDRDHPLSLINPRIIERQGEILGIVIVRIRDS